MLQAFADLGPDFEPQNMIECKIHWHIIFQYQIGEAECEKYWITIVKDTDWKYYNTSNATPKEYYQKFSGEWDTHATHEKCPPSSKIPLEKNTDYFLTIRKHYVYDNFAIETDTQISENWKKLPNCYWNLIDDGSLNNIQEPSFTSVYTSSTNYATKEHQNIFIIWWIAIIVCIIGLWIFIWRKSKK